MASATQVITAPPLESLRVLDDSQLATVLHCIRFYQEVQDGTYGDCRLGCCDHFDEADELSAQELDQLAESLNLDSVWYRIKQ